MLSRLLTRREQLVLFFVAAALMVGSAAVFLGGSPPDPSVPAPPGEAPLPDGSALVVPVEAGLAGETAQTLVAEPVVPTLPPEMSAAEVVVSVRGAVARPGLVTLPAESRVQDLLDAAGGAQESADLSNINVAARLIDGTTLTVPQGVRITESADGVAIERRSSAHVANPPEYTIYGWRPEAGAVEAGGGTAEAQSSSGSGLINLNRATQAQLEELPGIGPKLAASIIAYREKSPYRRVEDLTEVSGIGPKRLEAVRDLVTVR